MNFPLDLFGSLANHSITSSESKMEKLTLNYSMKNIPLPSKKTYLKLLTDKVEKLIKRVRWKVFYFENPDTRDNKPENFGFRSTKCPPQHSDLKNFENDLLDLIQNISFKQVHNEFQNKIRADIKRITTSEKAFIQADKTRNLYELDKETHDKLYLENVTKTYKIADSSTYDEINSEAKTIARNLKIDDKTECLAKSTAFITLKDHKDNFENNPKCRLINPAKPEIGKVSKFIIDKLNKTIRESIKVNQWHNSDDVIEWFTKLPNKSKGKFIQFDIVEFYPSISRDLLSKTMDFAKTITTVSKDDERIIYHSRKSLLFTNENAWVKNSNDPNFDVTMGSFDGAEMCELVGLYILNKLSQKYDINASGLYRDDGLNYLTDPNGHKSDRIRKELIKLFREEFGLKITIEINLTTVNFLDVTFDLKKGSYRPYSKPNDTLMYINVESNHPPNIIKGIPKMISGRISKISSNQTVFKKASRPFNEALKSCGYNEEIKFEKRKEKPKKSRSRKIIWFNPPFSLSVKTNVAKRFLSIVNKNFPKTHKFYKFLNRNTLKVSYSCSPNISSIVSAHNKKVLKGTPQNQEVRCNCRVKSNCPLDGKCLDKSVIYKCHVKSNPQDDGFHYIGLTEGTFKKRWYNHCLDFKNESKEKSTELSKHIWSLKRVGTVPIMKWEIIDHAPAYRNGSKTCNLCLTEKYHIISSKLKLLNKRTELISKCRHSNKFYLNNYKSVPPDK